MGVGWLMDGLMCCGVVLCTLHYPTQTEKMMNKAHSYLDITLVNNLVCLPTCLPACLTYVVEPTYQQQIYNTVIDRNDLLCYLLGWLGWVGLMEDYAAHHTTQSITIHTENAVKN